MHIRNRRGQRTRSQKSCTHTSSTSRCYTQFSPPLSIPLSLFPSPSPALLALQIPLGYCHNWPALELGTYCLKVSAAYSNSISVTQLTHCSPSSLSLSPFLTPCLCLSGVSIGVAYIYFNCPLRVRLLEVINSVQVQLEFEFEFVFDC